VCNFFIFYNNQLTHNYLIRVYMTRILCVISSIDYTKACDIQGDSKRWTQFNSAFTQTAYLLKFVIPTANALPR